MIRYVWGKKRTELHSGKYIFEGQLVVVISCYTYWHKVTVFS